MKTSLILSFIIALPVAAQSLSVRELKSGLPAGETVDTAALADQVRDVGRRILPDLEIAEAGKPGDLEVSGEVVRLQQEGYLVSLELRDAKSAKLSGTSSSAASTPEELFEAVASAAVDLFRGYKAASSLVMAAAQPTPPAPLGKLDATGVDAAALVAIDEARSSEAHDPDDAAAAWRAAAELPGTNPLRETLAARAKEWRDFAESRRAFEAQLSKDTARLKKVLPLAAVTDATKIELLVRYTRAYGAQRASALLGFMPREARGEAELSIGCEAKEAAKCVSLARAAKDPRTAAGFLDAACMASDAASCAEAGDRFLQTDLRDPARAVALLQRGCAADGAGACARLARVYEEGDGVVPNLALGAESREKACTAGDGASCRKLACDVPSALPRAAELWQRGCKDGDAISCALARLSRSPATRGQPTPGVRQASTAPAAEQPKPAAVEVSQPAAEPSNRRRGAGFTFLAIAAVAGGGALLMANDGAPRDHDEHFHRNWLSEGGDARRPPNRLSLVLGGAAVLSAAAGIGILLSKPEAPQKLSVGIAPGGIALSGTLP